MVLANINLGDMMLSLLTLFFMVIYFMAMFHVIVDVFRKPTSGVKRALWIAALIVFPLASLLVYVVTNGDGMAQRQMQAVAERQDQVESYIREVSAGAAGEIEKAKGLLDAGVIDEEEFATLKGKALAGRA